MKRTPVFLTLSFILTVLIGLILYNYFTGRESLKVWDLVPGQAVIIYEVGECSECLEQLGNTSFWQTINTFFINEFKNDSIGKLVGHIFNPKSKGFISMHQTQKDDFDFIFYIPEAKNDHHVLELEKWRNKKSAFTKREYNGIEINEINVEKKIFSWTSIEKIWVGSYTPYLIEDVIRTYKLSQGNSDSKQFESTYKLPRIENDAGNIYIDLNGLTNFLSVFLNNKADLLNLGQASLLDVKQRENGVTLNGFSVANKGTQMTLFSFFEDQSPVPFSIKQYISSRSIATLNYGITAGSPLFNKLELFNNKSLMDSLGSLAKVDFPALFSGLGNEMALSFFESWGSMNSHILVFETTNHEVWLKSFDQFSRAAEKGDSLYFEKYSNYEIREIGIKKFPEKLFKPLISGFDQTYYTYIDNVIIISDQVEELRRYLDDVEREDVWGKSVEFNHFLESTLLESNISIYINTPRALQAVSAKLNPKWKNIYASAGRNAISSLGFSAYQFSHLNETFYTNITWSFDSERKEELKKSQHKIQSNVEQVIISEPYVVQNHLTKKEEYVVQDSLYFIHYFSDDGKRQWRKDISGKIIGPVYQVDFLKNNKLQLFFIANGKLHVIDRLGNYVSPFPVSAPQQNIDFVSLIDYDNSKRYRYLLTDKQGKLWLLDKDGRTLDGWKPMNVEERLFAKPNHHRIRGKDFILAIRKDGWAYLKNRRGEDIKGFPLNLELKPNGDYFLEIGNSLANSNFVVTSRDGTKVKFNVEGKIVSKDLLIKSAVDDEFSLVVEENQKSYLILRQNSRQLALLDHSGKVVLINDFIGSKSARIRYYDFGSEQTYILISDLSQQLCYVYDGRGNLLTPVPIEATGTSMKVVGEKVLVITTSGPSLTIQPLPD